MRDGAGTPLYMAPERLLRFAADEIKCDIYSMGVTLCEALTLKRPFRVPDDLTLAVLWRRSWPGQSRCAPCAARSANSPRSSRPSS